MKSVSCAAIVVFAAAVGLAGQAAGENLLPNPTFEAEANGQPEGWETETWAGEAEFDYADTGYSADRSVSISSETGADAAWTATVPIETPGTYRLSGRIRTEGLDPGSGEGALLNVHGIDNAVTESVTGDSGWTEVSVSFGVSAGDDIQVNCLFGGWGESTGQAWFDDVELTLDEYTDLDPVVQVDGEDLGEPISEYIYSQFIEHLGRCIYGGIWAEMLEDRKFFHFLDDDASPWDVTGGYSPVAVNSFVGEHTPMIRLTDGPRRGITQDGLTLEEGRAYEGYVWLAGNTGGAPIEVNLMWGEGEDEQETILIEELSREFEKTEFSFTAGGDTEDGALEIMSDGLGHFSVGTVSLMPGDNVDGMRADTLELLKELDAPMYRWPGGNFVSGYDWRDGIGHRDRRPPRRNPAWQGSESNDFGLDEFIAFCREVDAEPHVVVNTGGGDLEMALDQIEYCNGPADSPMGEQRAANGHEEPYDIRWWGVGNEMFGDWQIGYIPIDDYTERHNMFAEAMREAEPDALLTASGQTGYWTEALMRESADHMDFIGEHFYVSNDLADVAAHMRQVPDAVRGKAEAHREYREEIEGLAEKDIPIAMTEWNYWYGPHVYGELGTQYYQKDALGIAAGIHEMARQSDIIHVANYAQTVNVIGAIKTSDTDAIMDTTGVVLTMYRRYFGETPLAVDIGEPFDAMAAWSEDGSTLTVGIVNPTGTSYEIPLEANGITFSGEAEGWTAAHEDPMAHNEPGEPQQVSMEPIGEFNVEDGLPVAPYSATVFHIETE